MIKLYIGKSGAGKDTFLKKNVACGVKPIISYTTRPMRSGEKQYVDYHFVSDEDFERNEDKMFEVREYNTLFNGVPAIWKYGSPIVNPKEDWVGVADINGAMSYIDYYGAENIEIIYVYVDDEERKRRAQIRGTFSEEEWNRRLADDKNKFSYRNMCDLIKKLGRSITAIDNNGFSPKMKDIHIVRV